MKKHSMQEALAIFIEANLTKSQYEVVHQANKDVYPCYTYVPREILTHSASVSHMLCYESVSYRRKLRKQVINIFGNTGKASLENSREHNART